MTAVRMQEILKSITVICDTREHEAGNSAILAYFKEKGIPYTVRCLKFADYSFEIPPTPELNLPETTSFENEIVIEKKHSLDELSGNLAQNRERFENEFAKAKDAGAKLILMVLDGSWDKIIEHKYRTGLSEKSYMASLFSFIERYGIDLQFIPQRYSGMFIYLSFYYHLRHQLKLQRGENL